MKQGRPVWGVLFCVTLFIASVAAGLAGAGGTTAAQAGPMMGAAANQAKPGDGNVLRITRADRHAVKKVAIEVGRAIVVETDEPVRDVMVSNPEAVDAVLHTSKRVHVIARQGGLSNVMFYGHNGNLLATLSISNTRFSEISKQERALEKLIAESVPGSNVSVKIMAGAAPELKKAYASDLPAKVMATVASDAAKGLVFTVILRGGVRTPADSARATRIAKAFMGVIHTDIKDRAERTGEEEKGEVLNLLKVADREQIMLKVVIAEVQRTVLKQMGINLGAVLTSGNLTTTVLTENALPITSVAGLGGLPTAGIDLSSAPQALKLFNNGPGASSYGNSGIDGVLTSGQQRFAYALRALERAGVIRTLAEPTLSAVSGETADFLAGGEVPYVTYVDPKTGQITTDFKKYGVELAFTPVVLAENMISLKIKTGVSEIVDFIDGMPVFDRRNASTTLELPSGGSMVLAGLISDKSKQNMDGFPGAKDIPILGTLFRSRDFQRRETELVIIVTPYITRPVNRAKLARPDDGFAPASDAKANFLGQLNRVYGGEAAAVMPDGYKGDVGFIIE